MSEANDSKKEYAQPLPANEKSELCGLSELADARYATRLAKKREKQENRRQRDAAFQKRMRKNRYTRLFAKGIVTLRQSGVCYTLRRTIKKLTEGTSIRLPRYTDADYEAQRREKFEKNIKFSILVPLYNTPDAFLREMIASVQAQTYSNWELCLADGSDAQHADVERTVRTMASEDARICYRRLEKNLGISGNTNACIDMATGEYIALFDHDDLLHPSALYEMMRVICDEDADFVYTDETTFESPNVKKILNTHYKPDFAPDNLRANNYICHFSAFSRALLEKVGGFRSQYDGSQDHDMILRLTSEAQHVAHIPKILYFWRSHPLSVAMDIDSKGYAVAAGQNAVKDSIQRMGLSAVVESSPAFPTIYRARYALERRPLVSIVITVTGSVKQLSRCIGAILALSTYRPFEIIIADDAQPSRAKEAYYAKLSAHSAFQICRSARALGNSARKNEAAGMAKGEYLVFLEDDTRIMTPDWIEELLSYAQRADVAAVGGKLYYPNQTLRHGGTVLGFGKHGAAGTVFHRMPRLADGYMGRLFYAQNHTAVCGACMMISAADFWLVGGFDPTLSEFFYDTDLCLRLRQKEKLTVWTPFCEATRYHSIGNGKKEAKDAERFRARWQELIDKGDPYYNPNLSTHGSGFGVRKENDL